MKGFILGLYTKLIAFGYERAFHEVMSDEVKNFVRNLSYVGLGTFIATIFSFAFNILAGRTLGPSGYGEFTLIQSVAAFLCIPMSLGFSTAMVKYNAEKEEYFRQKSIISITYITIFILIIISILIYCSFQSQIAKVFSISNRFLFVSIIYAMLSVFYMLTTSTLRSLHKMKNYAIFQPIYSIILLLTALILIAVNYISYESMILSMCLAYGMTGGIILISIRKYLSIEFDRYWANRLMSYSNYAIIGGLSSAFYSNIDKILINEYMDVVNVGVYRAYSYSFLTVVMLFISVFITVFFPVASKSDNKEAILKKINKIIPYLIVFGIPTVMVSGFFILKLYGKDYPFDLKLALLFGIAAISIFIDNIYGGLMNSVGMRGVKITSFAAIIVAVVNIFLNMLLIRLIGIEGSIIAIIISYNISIGIVLSKQKYLYN